MRRRAVGELLLLAVLFSLVGCTSSGSGSGAGIMAKPAGQQTTALPGGGGPKQPDRVTPVTDQNFTSLVSKSRPNELGRVLILEYHDFKETEERWARRWDHFRNDLETLYAKGYRAVNLRDYIQGSMPLPAGTSPVIFTFDDSHISQLKLMQQNGKWVADPHSAVGMMLKFKEEHPDFGAAGTFYVNFTPVPFREPENWEVKLRCLQEHGFEMGQHTADHEGLGHLSPEAVRKALGEQVKRIRAVLPEYDGWTLALPFGDWPKPKELALQGEYEGVRYQHRAVLLVGSDPVYSPYDKRLDLTALPRVQAIDEEFARWYPFLEENRYISDGDPDTIVIPEEMAEHLNPEAVKGRHVRTYKAGHGH